MYKCEICGTVSQPRTPSYKVTLETRAVTYPLRPKVNAAWKWKNGQRKYVRIDDRGGVGKERAREVTACAACAVRFTTKPG